MRTSAWVTILGVAGLAVACGDQPTEVVPERETPRRGGMIALATSSSDDGLSITTDKDDYAPGDTVMFTGAGWPAADTLDVVLTDDTGDEHSWWIPTIEDGTFRDSTYIVNEGDLNVTFNLTATSRATGRWLSVTFTDGQPTSVTVTPETVTQLPGPVASYDVAVAMGGSATNACTVILEFTSTTLPSGAVAKIDGSALPVSVTLPAGSSSTPFSKTLTVTTAGVAAGTYTFTLRATRGSGCQGTAGTGPTDNGTLILLGPAAKLAFDQQPTSSTGGATITPAITVRVLDANDNLVSTGTGSNASVSLALANNPSGGTLGGTLTQSAVNGVATFANLTVDKIGTGYTLGASSSGLTGATSNAFNITLGAASKLVFTAAPSGGTAGTPFVPQPVVAVTDAGGNPRTTGQGSGASVVLSLSSGTGLSCNALSVTASAGIATFAGCNIAAAGTGFRLHASANVGGTTFQTDTDPFDIGSGNQAPSVDAAGPYSGSEGSPISLSDATATDPDNDALDLTWSSASGKCTFSNTKVLNPTVTCTDNGSYTVTLTADDGHGHAPSSNATVNVSNANPTATFTKQSPVDEGSSFTLALTSPNDASSDDVAAGFTYAFDCDDGAGYGSFTSTASKTCSTTDNGTRNVKAKLKDKDGGVGEYSGTVTVENVAPEATFTAESPVNEGSSFQLELSDVQDPSSDDVAAGFTYAFNCGSGYDGFGSSSTASCTTDDNGVRSVGGKVKDKDGGVSTYTASVTVNNVAPTATGLTTNSPVDEGSDIIFSVAGASDVSSVDAASLRYAFDCGDGNGYDASTYSAASDQNSKHCTTTDNGSRTVKGKVFDKDGGISTEQSKNVTISNVAPSITAVSADPTGPLTLGSNNQVSTTVTVTFTDPAGTHDQPYATAITCGNGAAAVTGSPTTYGSSSATCTYTAATVGTRTISATVTDKDGGTSTAGTTTVQVLYNWTGFFQPVDNPPGYNTVKAGSGIPLKFNLNGNQGLGIFETGYPKPFTVSCDATAPYDAIEETVNAGQSSLTYDESAHQYIYVWKSDRTWTGCRRLEVKLKDGSTHSATFKFNK